MRLAVPIPEAAELIGCSPSMMWKLIGQGLIAKAKVGRRTVIRVAELERYLAESEQENASAATAKALSKSSSVAQMEAIPYGA